MQQTQTPQEPKVVCNTPYMQVGSECCLDRDGSGVCDRDETPTTTEPTAQTTEDTEAQASTTIRTTTTLRATTTTVRQTTTTHSTSTTTTLPPTTTLPLPCMDPPSGKDPYVRGTVKKGAEWATDKCEGTVTLIKFYCENNFIVSSRMECPLGCADGHCLGCTDSDGGDNPDVYGEVKLGILTKKDICSNQKGRENVLREFYCVNATEVNSHEVTCAGTCTDGACA